ncbi:protein LEAD-SENSITIVE 1-like isoform X1 [Quercus robur]|uniref:protein LEAD-SENSITIVE 1-like isoform X1 n=1 Tax=Quercus robur TaxID=38942 RepID=UPI0021624231|nr:protein LEAD-SENSITIVE 1-like isoform X1 [Quercus robur]
MGVVSNKIERENLKPGDHIYSWRLAYAYSHHGIYVNKGNVIHFTRGEGQEIGTGTALDNIIGSSLPQHPLENPCPICGDESRRDGVISSCIDCFLSGGDLYRYEYGVTPAFFLAKARGGTCTLAVSESEEQVIHRAFYFLRKGFGVYHVMKNNCEDFALCCKTGLKVIPTVKVGQSGQAVSFQAAASFQAAGVFLSVPLAYLGRSSPLAYAATSVGSLAASYGTYCVNRYINDIGVRQDVMRVVLEE